MYSFGCFHPKIMGILNLTPDSFYTSSFRDTNQQFSFNQYKNVDIIDIGCESSRPGANPLPEKDELDRLAGFLYYITKIEKTLSIDTYKPAVARFALENGFNMINDINGGGENGEMFEIAAEYDCPIVVMHMKDQPSNMQDHPFYDDIIEELLNYFEILYN